MDGWLRGLKCPIACAGLLVDGLCPDMTGCRAVVVLGLVSACLWVSPELRESWDWCLTTGG